MRVLDAGIAAHIASRQTTLATCWKLVRSDGLVLGFTDHDRTIMRDGTAFRPSHGLDGTASSEQLGAQVPTTDILGVLSSEAITETDILIGRYDGARVETWRVNWQNPEEGYLKRVDSIGEIVREDQRFRAELRAPTQALNRVDGRVYHPLCDAKMGDARCGVNLAVPALSVAVSVLAVVDAQSVAIAHLGGFAEGWFTHGTLAWTSGLRSGLKDAVAELRIGASDTIVLRRRIGDTVTVGDTAVLSAGCNRQVETCTAKFANIQNFRGFPHIPGNDYVLRHPRSGDQLDGRPVVP